MKRWLKPNNSAADEANENPSTSKTKRRKFSDEYLAYGFTSTNLNGEERPQCVICYEVLSNESMKPAKLRRHLETKHQELREKSQSFFKIKASELKRSKNIINKTATGTNNESAVLASYQVSLLIAKKGKPHTIAEELILPCAKVMVSAMLGEKASKELDIISLSNNTVKSRIVDMSGNVKEQLIMNVKASCFYALQLDESTDISNDANLLCYVRYEHNDSISEDLLFCMPLPTHTTGEAIFEVLNNFMSTHEIPWEKCVAVSTDGARAMTGTRIGLQARVKKMNPSIIWHHCCIHREALAAKNMPEKLKMVLDDIVQVVNFIKARPLNSRIFGKICEEMGSVHKQLLLHAEVRWLSRGKVVSRVFELRDEIRMFFVKNSAGGANKHAHHFNDFEWLTLVAYLADIFSALNELNLGLQGRDNNIFEVEDKIETMLKKLDLWTNRTIQKNYNNFPTLAAFLESSDGALLPTRVQDEIINHLRALKTSLRDYFSVPDKNKNWIADPFTTDVSDITGLTAVQENQLIEISCDSALKRNFKERSLCSFWVNIKKDYKEVSEEALKHLLLFSTTYLCEKAFSTLVYIKNKYRNRLHVESDLRLQLSNNINPNISDLVAKKQHQPSH